MTGLCLDPRHAVEAFAGIPCTRARFITVEDILRERQAQDLKWGEQNHPDGTNPNASLLEDIGVLWSESTNGEFAEAARDRTDALARVGRLTFAHILLEEVAEALAEDDPQRLRTELVQVAAVATAWVEAIDRRGGAS